MKQIQSESKMILFLFSAAGRHAIDVWLVSESPRLRVYLSVGVVVFQTFPYREPKAKKSGLCQYGRTYRLPWLRSFNREMIVRPSILALSKTTGIMFVVALLAGCGEPMFENAGSQHSLLEDRDACAMEMEQSPEALAYRQNPTAHPDYMNQVFIDTNRCIERKGWKQVRSQQEQEQMREAIASELAQTGQPAPRVDSKATETFVRGVEERLARSSNSAR